MKFEGNIPSYLRTGAGSFAVSDKKLANVEKTKNLFEKVKFGIKDMAPMKPISIPTPREDYVEPNLFRSIQLNMEQKPELMAFEKERPVQQELPLELPDDMDDKLPMGDEKQDTQSQTDIFIG